MQNEPNLTPVDTELEAALRELSPSAPGIDATAAAYEAGRRSGRASLAAWRSAAALFAVSTAAALVAPRPGPEANGPMVEAPAPAVVERPAVAVARAEAHGPAAYLSTARLVLEQGPGALDATWQDDPRSVPAVR